jgi:hypothetical protein
MIPKNIIQICIGEETETHRYWLHLSKKWKLDYPDWNHKVYRDSEIEEIVKSYSDLAWEMYATCPILSFRADFARLILLYTHGGLYIDIDSRPNLDLDAYVINSDNIRWGFYLTINEQQDPWEIVTNNHLAASEKHSNMVKEMIDTILDKFILLKSEKIGDAGQEAGFKFAKLVSTSAWGAMLYKKLNELHGSDFVKHHISRYGKTGLFWITWDGESIKTKKDRGFITHVGSILLKDFLDVNLPIDPMKKIGELYKDLTPHNGEIKIYSGGINGV